ncbi:MAG: efflux RND transporter periplasmic adaptor subunit [Alistipes sp.]|nr:efflux RND transporter periplasmic adaptor subunit [Alistipes sp.]
MKPLLLLLCAALITACTAPQAFDATGTFEATEVTVSAEAAGRILSLDLEEGDSVCTGIALGAIDSMQLYLSKLQLQKSMTSVSVSRPDISKQIAATQEQIAKQETELRRIERLLAAGAATQKQWDDNQSALRVLQRQLSAQSSTLHLNTASLNAQSSALDLQVAQTDDRLAKCRIFAPVNGTVLSKYAEAGEMAAVGKPLFRIADLRQLYLRAYVTSEQLATLKLGQTVKVVAQFGADAQRNYSGRITWIASESEFTPKNIQTVNDRADLVYALKISVENDGYLKIGTYGEVYFETK